MQKCKDYPSEECQMKLFVTALSDTAFAGEVQRWPYPPLQQVLIGVNDSRPTAA